MYVNTQLSNLSFNFLLEFISKASNCFAELFYLADFNKNMSFVDMSTSAMLGLSWVGVTPKNKKIILEGKITYRLHRKSPMESNKSTFLRKFHFIF
jgi:hypothetical protein